MDKIINLQAEGHFGHLPKNIGRFTLSTPNPQRIWNILPFDEEKDTVLAALDLPIEKGQYGECAWGQVIDNGWDSYLLIANEDAASLDEPPFFEGLKPHAAIFDVTESYAVLRIAGENIQDVMERLVPLDLRTNPENQHHAFRSLMGHISVLMMKVDMGYEIFIPASMAQSAYHEIVEAIETVSALSIL